MLWSIILLVQFVIHTAAFNEAPADSAVGDVIVHVEDIQDIKGELLLGIYNSKRTFRKVKKVFKYAVKSVESGREVIVLKNIPEGTYAIAIFQDFNGNRKFDSNFMGIPKEPFGFSTNYQVKVRAPRFREVTFEHTSNDTEMTIKIQKW
jgi:uncharacterized protein (DUF2141 family)